MISKIYYQSVHLTCFVCLTCFLLAGCSTPHHLEFDDAFELSLFLKNYIQKLPGQRIEFQVITQHGESVPFGILCFQWVEGGQMDFQTDPNGVLRMEFEEDILEHEVMVSTKLKASKVRVTW